jgi:hypothetical protein
VTSAGLWAALGERLGGLSLAARVAAAAAVALALILGAGSWVMWDRTTATLENQGLTTITDKVLVRAMVESKANGLRVETERLNDMFAAGFTESFSVNAGGDGMPVLMHGGTAMNLRFRRWTASLPGVGPSPLCLLERATISTALRLP